MMNLAVMKQGHANFYVWASKLLWLTQGINENGQKGIAQDQGHQKQPSKSLSSNLNRYMC